MEEQIEMIVKSRWERFKQWLSARFSRLRSWVMDRK